jgi:hypothetical protein
MSVSNDGQWKAPYARRCQYRTAHPRRAGAVATCSQKRPAATIYVGDSPSLLNDKIDWKLTPVSTEQATGYGLSWTAAGQLLQRDAAFHIFMTGFNGGNRVRLLENDDVVFVPNACGLGDIVVVGRVTENNAPNLWRLNIVTGERKQLTFGKDEEKGSCTPDGKWVVYNGPSSDGVGHIFKISIDGGAPVELARGTRFDPPVSPDGRLIACGRTDGLAPDPSRWIACRPRYFLPAPVLSCMFRGKMLAFLKHAYDNHQLHFPGTLAAFSKPGPFHALLSTLRHQKWVVYAKAPFGGRSGEG